MVSKDFVCERVESASKEIVSERGYNTEMKEKTVFGFFSSFLIKLLSIYNSEQGRLSLKGFIEVGMPTTSGSSR